MILPQVLQKLQKRLKVWNFFGKRLELRLEFRLLENKMKAQDELGLISNGLIDLFDSVLRNEN